MAFSATWLLVLFVGCQPEGQSTEPPPTGIAGCGGVGGSIRSMSVTLPERGTGRMLTGQVLAPDAGRQQSPCPVLSLLPGGGASISSVRWAAERLAASGYVVVVTQPAAGVSIDAYHRAVVSGIDFLQSPANPYAASADTGRVGVAGWSLGGRTLTRTQAEDLRVDALVAWDNLAISESGDAGSPACENVPGTIRQARVPAMGQASESCASLPADTKLIAYEHWRRVGVPVMQVVFAGATHFWWSAEGGGMQHDLIHAYTRAWFDRWLKGDAAASASLLSGVAPGTTRPAAEVLSARFRSAAAFDGRVCANLRAGC